MPHVFFKMVRKVADM